MLGLVQAGRGHGRSWVWRGAAVLGVCLPAAWAFAPALRAAFIQDDFLLLALARLLDQPWQVFWHDHFFGSPFFRPLGIFAWWLATACFDTAPRGQYGANLVLHLGVVFALYRLLQTLHRDAGWNAAWSAAFAVHPVAIGTALWLSDRFDLIAVAFSLLALGAAVRYARAPRAQNLIWMLLCVLAAFMGKEIAIVGAFAVCALFVLPNRDWPLARSQRIAAIVAVVIVVAAWLAWRAALLGNPQNALVHANSMVAMFARGTWLWLRVGYGYFIADSRQSSWTLLLQAAGALLIALALVAAIRRRRSGSGAWGLAAALATLILLPAPTQAPVVSLFVSDPGVVRDWFYPVIESRLFYISFAGLIVALALATAVPDDAADAPVANRVNLFVGAGLAALIVAWTWASHAIAHDWASRTRAEAAPLQAVDAAIAKLDLPLRRCQIYLLGATAIRGLADSSDAMVKATTPDLDRVRHCLIQTERTPWGSFLPAGETVDYSPLRPLTHDGVPLPWLELGRVRLAYFNLDADIDARTIDGAFFLDYRNGEFVDVSADVRSGRRPVQFFNARPQQK